MARFRAALALPTLVDWALTLAITIGFALIAAGFGLATGLYQFRPEGAAIGMLPLLRSALIVFIAPGILEEIVFRGPLLVFPKWFKKGALGLSALVLLALFVLWHPFNAIVFLTDARSLFFDWRFLTVAAALGAAASWLVLRTRSLWPAIFFHAALVFGWKTLLGGPEFF